MTVVYCCLSPAPGVPVSTSPPPDWRTGWEQRYNKTVLQQAQGDSAGNISGGGGDSGSGSKQGVPGTGSSLQQPQRQQQQQEQQQGAGGKAPLTSGTIAGIGEGWARVLHFPSPASTALPSFRKS